MGLQLSTYFDAIFGYSALVKGLKNGLENVFRFLDLLNMVSTKFGFGMPHRNWGELPQNPSAKSSPKRENSDHDI